MVGVVIPRATVVFPRAGVVIQRRNRNSNGQSHDPRVGVMTPGLGAGVGIPRATVVFPRAARCSCDPKAES